MLDPGNWCWWWNEPEEHQVLFVEERSPSFVFRATAARKPPWATAFGNLQSGWTYACGLLITQSFHHHCLLFTSSVLLLTGYFILPCCPSPLLKYQLHVGMELLALSPWQTPGTLEVLSKYLSSKQTPDERGTLISTEFRKTKGSFKQHNYVIVLLWGD